MDKQTKLQALCLSVLFGAGAVSFPLLTYLSKGFFTEGFWWYTNNLGELSINFLLIACGTLVLGIAAAVPFFLYYEHKYGRLFKDESELKGNVCVSTKESLTSPQVSQFRKTLWHASRKIG
ncbi:membrane protein [Bacillus phage Nachito]|nr:membrane protein [Bacillus phage Nachito]